MNKKKRTPKGKTASAVYAKLPSVFRSAGLAPIGEYGECADPLVVARRTAAHQNPKGIRPLPEDRLAPFLRGETADLPRRPPGQSRTGQP